MQYAANYQKITLLWCCSAAFCSDLVQFCCVLQRFAVVLQRFGVVLLRSAVILCSFPKQCLHLGVLTCVLAIWAGWPRFRVTACVRYGVAVCVRYGVRPVPLVLARLSQSLRKTLTRGYKLQSNHCVKCALGVTSCKAITA